MKISPAPSPASPDAASTGGPWVRWTGIGLGLAVAGVIGWVSLHHHLFAHKAVAGPSVAALKTPAPRAQRLTADTLVVPNEVLWSFGIRTAEASSATRPRLLPPLTGCLAVDSNRLAHVHSLFAGEIVALGTVAGGEAERVTDDPAARLLQTGDRVQAGQLLAVVWSKDLGEKKSELVDALSRLRVDKETLNRLKNAGEGVVAQRQIRDAERTVESDLIAVARAEATLRSWRVEEKEIHAAAAEAERLARKESRRALAANHNWARVEVRAKSAGIILEKNVTVGDVVDTTVDLFKVADLSKLAVWAHVYEDDLPALQALPRPIQWSVQMPANPAHGWTGTLERIGEIVDPNQHTVLVSGLVDNPSGDLKAGQFITAAVALPAQPGEVEVPSSALVEDGRESILFVQEDSQEPRFARRRVSVVRRFHDVVYVRADPAAGTAQALHAGERVVTSGAIHLKEALDELPQLASAHQ
jgi:cobalt-zinc-cadmium efflux system membrane fusion protein